MKLQHQTSLWGCTVGAAAMLFDIPIKEMLLRVGHDGSAIIHKDIRSPGNRKGFHIQEIISIGLDLGFGLVPIEAAPVQTATGMDFFDVKIRGYASNERRLQLNMKGHPGLIMGKLSAFWHCVAWDGKSVFDPRGTVYSLDDCKIRIQTFWRLVKCK